MPGKSSRKSSSLGLGLESIDVEKSARVLALLYPTKMEFEQLELLSLVSKITQELSNHVGVSDKTLAEFIIDTHKNSKSLEEFKENLNSMDAGFSDSFMENLDRLIVRMHPNHPRKNKIKIEDDGKHSKFSGLALPDQQRDWDEEEKVTKRKMDVKEMDDTLDQLVGLEKTVKSERKSRKRSRSPSPEYRERRRSPEYRDRQRRPRSRDKVLVTTETATDVGLNMNEANQPSLS